jgi:methylated-DNA-protein-cysteine methyltransferase related protein
MRRAPVSTLARLRHLIAEVPRGKVITYGQVAAAGGRPGAARLTVWALQAGEGLPWHRVVAAGGRIALTGVLAQEQRLRLALEGVTFRGGRVRMELHGWVPGPRVGRGPPVRQRSRTKARKSAIRERTRSDSRSRTRSG